ncbi:amino acid-binding ACT domain protein [Acidaminococcus sp. CAG:917]|nr:amino acid-binding ACT domain protein [Acidaminococcus sp. CAG:917]
MLVNQIAVFLENRTGRLLSLSKALSDSGIDLVSLNIADTSDFGIVRMITSDNEKAAKALKEAGFVVKQTELVSIEVDDTPGGLTKVLEALGDSDIDIEYLYSYAKSNSSKASILFKTSDIDKANKILKDKKLI